MSTIKFSVIPFGLGHQQTSKFIPSFIYSYFTQT